MKAVILAGGVGSRISEESHLKPKPMIEIGGKPILWHIMKIYSAHGINDFVICCGYKGYVIKEYFANYFFHNSDVTFHLKNNDFKVHTNASEPWNVTVVDTGENTQTGGRLKKVRQYLDEGEDFCFTYGDGVSDIPIRQLVQFHKDNGRLATVTAVQPPGRFGVIQMKGTQVEHFLEKPVGDGAHINGGFFVMNTKAIDYVEHDQIIWERQPMENLAKDQQMSAFIHKGFWHPMDTLRDKGYLENLWQSGQAPWKQW